jgi:transcriptional regulator with XRE-family HTH domain
MTKIGAKIREARRGRRMTQKQLAIKSGISQNWISDLETGKAKKGPNSEHLHRLALALGYKSNFFFPNETTPNTEPEEVARYEDGGYEFVVTKRKKK